MENNLKSQISSILPESPNQKEQLIPLIERGFKDEIVNYQGKLGIFIYAGLQGYFTKHFGDITEGEKAYKEAMRKIESDWSSKKNKESQ